MNSRARVLSLVLLLLGGPHARAAQTEPPQGDEVTVLSRQVSELFSKGRFDDALPPAKRAVEAGERLYGPDDLRLTPALANLAILSLVRHRYDEAEPLFQRGVRLLEQKAGPNDARLAGLLMPYGWLRLARGDRKQAEAFIRRSVALLESAYGPDSPEVALHLTELANLYRALWQFDKADPAYRRAAAVLEKAEGLDTQYLRRTLENHLCLQVSFSKTKEANQTLKRLAKVRPPGRGATPPARRQSDAGQISLGRTPGDEEMSDHDPVGTMDSLLLRGKPTPEYPTEAQVKRIEGTVVVRVLVDEAGKVTSATPMCAHPVLMEAARKSAAGARFTPSTSGGKPVRVSGYLFYHFYFDKSTVGQWTPVVR